MSFTDGLSTSGFGQRDVTGQTFDTVKITALPATGSGYITHLNETFPTSGTAGETPELVGVSYDFTPNTEITTSRSNVVLGHGGTPPLAEFDYLWVIIAPKQDDAAYTITPPAGQGWVLDHMVEGSTTGATGAVGAMYIKHVTAAEAASPPANFTFALDRPHEFTAVLMRWRGVNHTQGRDVPPPVTAADTGSIVSPSITTVTDGTRIFAGAWVQSGSRELIPPAGSTTIVDPGSTADRALRVIDRGVQPTAGASGTTAWSLNPQSTSIPFTAFTAALRPVPATTTATWDAAWLRQAAGSATLGGFTITNGRGRMALPAGRGSALSARRLDLTDFDMFAEVGGEFDTTSGVTQEHYREIHFRGPTDPAVNSASLTADHYDIVIDPTSTLGGAWQMGLRRTVNGVRVRLANAPGVLPAGTRQMKIRLSVAGRRFRAKVWPASSPEPAAYQIDHTDSTTFEAITRSGSIALVGVSGGSACYVDWDNVVVSTTGGLPTISSVTAPAGGLLGMPIDLSVVTANSTGVQWFVSKVPRGGLPGGTFSDATAATTTFTPDTAGGDYVLEVVARNASGNVSALVTVPVRPHLWQYVGAGPTATIVPIGLVSSPAVTNTDRPAAPSLVVAYEA